MMKKDSSRHRAGQKRGAIHRMVPALFLCSALFSQAASNWWDGVAYGTNDWSTASSISSITNGAGSLIVGHDSTTSLFLNHKVSGFVWVTNGVNNFEIAATTNAAVSGSGYAVLYIDGGTNLTISGGAYTGTTGISGQPPIPDLGDGTNAIGGLIVNSEDVMIAETEFTGAIGAGGLDLKDSSVTISNGIFRGGDGGSGVLANGATALLASGTTLEIVDGTFSGGTAGSTSGSFGGAALMATSNSMVTIHAGSFTGGVGNTAFYLQDSDATVHGGTFVGDVGSVAGAGLVAGDGLFSKLTAATTNEVNLHGGTFSSLAFYGVDGSVQHFLAGTNLIVQNGIIQDGGAVIIENQNNSALQQVLILNGTMSFNNDFTLGSNGVFSLQNGTMEFGNDFTLGSNSVFSLYQSQLVAAGNMEFASDSMLALNASTGGYAAVMADTATFQTNSTLLINASETVFSEGTNDVDLLKTTSGIFVAAGGMSTNATTTNFDLYVNTSVTNHWLTTFNGAFIDGGNALRLQFVGGIWGNAWDVDGQPKDLANELQTLDDGTMADSISSLDKESFKTATETTYFTTMNTFQTVLHGTQAAVGQSVSRGAEFREQLNLKPSGARGPSQNNDLRGWAKYYGQFYSHDAEGLNQEYESTLHGGVIGIDKSIGNLLVGISGGAGDYSTTTTGSDDEGEENITAYHGALYGTYGINKAYIDAGIAYGFNEVETQTAEPFVLNGEFDAQILNAYLGGGIDLVDSTEGMVFTPEASIQYSMYEQDSYSETSDNAVPRNIDAFDADSLRSSLGLNVSIRDTMTLETFSFKYDLRFHWIHEFNPDPGTVGFSLEGGNNDYQLAYPMLDEDLYRAGIGVAFFNTLRNQPKNVLFRIDFDELFGDGFNSHNLSVKVIYAF